MVPTLKPTQGEHLVVISPHLDDAVLSVGATLAHLAKRGVDVLVLTVFGGDPRQEREPGDSNRRAGFATTGEAARARRIEDDAACACLGVHPLWLPFDDDESSARDAAAIGAALGPTLRSADMVLLPGSPLVHPDHLLVARLVAEHAEAGTPLGLYLEQPYAAWQALGRRSGTPWRTTVPAAPIVVPVLGGGEPVWRRSPACPRCQHRKLTAAGAYRSQLVVLRRWPRLRIAAYESLAGGERVAWPSYAPRTGGPD